MITRNLWSRLTSGPGITILTESKFSGRSNSPISTCRWSGPTNTTMYCRLAPTFTTSISWRRSQPLCQTSRSFNMWRLRWPPSMITTLVLDSWRFLMMTSRLSDSNFCFSCWKITRGSPVCKHGWTMNLQNNLVLTLTMLLACAASRIVSFMTRIYSRSGPPKIKVSQITWRLVLRSPGHSWLTPWSRFLTSRSEQYAWQSTSIRNCGLPIASLLNRINDFLLNWR